MEADGDSLATAHQGKSAFTDMPEEAIERIFSFCHKISLTYLYQTNHTFRCIAMKEMSTRIQKLDPEKKFPIQSPDAIIDIWTKLTVGKSCFICAKCSIDGVDDVKRHPLIGDLVCRECFMNRIHAERPKFREDKYTREIICRTIHGRRTSIDTQYDVPCITKLSKGTVQNRVTAYFNILDVLWDYC